MVRTVVINNKTYKVPELTFGAVRKLEEYGFSVMKIADINSNQFTAIHAFTMLVCDVDSDEADRLLQQHVLGGGDYSAIMNVFYKAITESDFFTQMLKKMQDDSETETPTQRSKTKKTDNSTVSQN